MQTLMPILFLMQLAWAPREDLNPQVAALEKAKVFEGAALGLNIQPTPTRRAYEKLLQARDPKPFLILIQSVNPAARLYAADGLTELKEVVHEELLRSRILPLLDDEQEVHHFNCCELDRSPLALEVFKRLGRFLKEEEIDDLCDRILREGLLRDRRSSKQLAALKRAQLRPTPVYLAYLLRREHPAAAAALLNERSPAAAVQASRTAAVREAISSLDPEIRLAAIEVALDVDPGAFQEPLREIISGRETTDLEQAHARAKDAAAALRAWGRLAVKVCRRLRENSGTSLEARLDLIRSALDLSRRSLPRSLEERHAAAALALNLAAALAALRAPAGGDAGAGAPPAPVAGVAEKLAPEVASQLALSIGTLPDLEAEQAQALIDLDPKGEQIRGILLGDFSNLDPRTFLRFARALLDSSHRAAALDHFSRLAEDAGAPWKDRLYAIRALGLSRDGALRPLLERLRGSDHPRLAGEAAEALKSLSGAAADPVKDARDG